MNLLATLKLNFRLLPLHQAWHLPILVDGRLRLDLGPEARVELPANGICRGLVRLGSRHETYKAAAGKSQLTLHGTWKVAGPVRIGVDSCVYIHRGATLTTGRDVFIARDSQIECFSQVSLGNNLLAGEVYICDTAGHAVSHHGVVQPMTKPIVVGDGCYLGFRTQLLRGTRIPAHSVVGSGAVCTRDYAASNPEGHVLLVGVPAQVHASDVTPDCHVG